VDCKKFDPNLLSGRIMRSQAHNFCLSVIVFACLAFFGADARAQEKPTSPSRETPTTKPQFPAAKKQTQPAEPAADADDPDKAPAAEADKDGPEQIRKRNEWFYKQRSSSNGRIPSGARLKAFQHMQRMMAAEGKLVLRPDGSYAAAAPQGAITLDGAVTTTWTSIGPTPTTGGFFSPVTGRVTTIAVDPSDSTGNTVLLGGAQGGIWRSTDAGTTWKAVGDQNASLAMGSIAFAPSQTSTVYAGTGESAGIGFDIYYGAGVLKSTDHGQTWTQTCTVPSATCPFIGPYDDVTPFGFFTLGGTRISYVAVNPSNPQMVLVGAQTQFAEGTTEGVYCSDNGGSTWSIILPDEMSTFVGFASSTVAYAAFGNPYGNSQGAPNGNGIYKATAIGSTCSTVHFARLTSPTLPAQSSMGRIDLGIAPSDTSGNTVYASISDASTASELNLGVFVTTNGGTSWTQTSAPDVCKFQCWYDNVIKVDPNNKSIVYFGGSSVRDSSGNPEWVIRSTDGGASWSSVIPSAQGPGLPHVDNHAIAFFKLPSGKVRMYLGNDGGVWRTDDAEAPTVGWTNLNGSTLTLTQFYPSISINASSPAVAFGGTQDNGSQIYGGTPNWTDNDQCGDGTGTAIDNLVPSSVYVACNGINIFSSYQNGAAGTFTAAVNGINFNDNYNFVPPLTTDPSTPNTVYLGTTKIYQSVDAANSWKSISNDLVGAPDYLAALAVAPTAPQVVYAGASNGEVFATTIVSSGGSASFNIVSGAVIAPRAVTAIAIDPADKTGATAYVAYSGFSFVNSNFGVNDPSGHIFKTTNFATWTDVSCSVISPANCATPAPTDLPNIPVNDIVIDPDLPGILYAATDLGVFVGNCTATPCIWGTLATGLPRVAVLSLRLHEPSRTLRAATHGRGVWDITLNNFSFSGPHISSLAPTSANANAAPFILTVTGTGLTGGTIQFGTTALASTGTQTDTSMSGTVPASLLVAGTLPISVKTASATSNSLPFAVTALTPTLTSLSPASTPVQLPPTTNVSITLTGANFSSSARVFFNGAQNGVTTKFNSSTSLTATLPAALIGPYGSTNDISVLNTPPGGGQSKPLAFKVVAPPPPNDNFANATNIMTLSFNDLQDTSSATTESADPLPPCANQYSSSNGNTGGHPNGLYNTLWYKFTPQFSANLNVDTTGSSYDTVLSVWTGAGTTEAALTATNIACNDDTQAGVVTQSQLQSVALTAGNTYYIMVSSFGPPDPNPIALGGKSQFNFSYNSGIYPAAILTSISVSSANSGDPDLPLTIIGSNFFNGAGVQWTNTVTFFGNLFPATFVSSTKLTTVIPAAAMALPGAFSIDVNNPIPNAGGSNPLPFTVNLGTYPVPGLTFMYPATMVAGSLPFTISVGGTNFVSSAVINFNGVAKTTTVNSTQNAYATISAADVATPGSVPVTISNPSPGGGPSAPLSFVITAPTVVPTITSVSPSSLPAGYSSALTVTGTGFIPGAAVEIVGGGNGYWPATVISATQLSISNFGANSTGTFPLYILDPSPAGTSVPLNYTFTQPPAPTITSLSPSTAPSGSTPTITITGTGFEQGATVNFNGASYFTGYTSSTQLTTVLSLGGVAAGTYPLTLADPIAAGSSAPFNFIVTGPPDFSITSSGTTTQTVPAGQTATFSNVISIAAQNGFSAQVNLVCSLPTTALYTVCSTSPASFPNGSGTASVMVTTKARGLVPPVLPRLRFIFRPQLVPVILLAILLAAFLLRLGRTRRQRWASALPLAGLAIFLLLQAIGCGGGYSSPPPPPPPTGTPVGTYPVTVTATSGALTHTTTMTLVVQ
jgi:IPT/TIG domain